MSYKILIPTYKRYDNVKPIAELGLPRDKFILCVNDWSEKKKYKEFYPDIEILSANKNSSVTCRNYILDYFKKGDRIIQVDDDVEGLYELRGKGRSNLIKMTGKEIDKLISQGFDLCEKNNTKLWGVYPVFNHFFMSRTIVPHGHVVGMWMGIIVSNLRMNEKLNSKADYQFTIEHILKYRKIVRFNYVCVKGTYKTNKGGLQTARTGSSEKWEADYLVDKYPQFVVRNTKREGHEILLKFKTNKE